MLKKKLIVNGMPRNLVVDPEASLAEVLRNQLFLLGTKIGCGTAMCGACNVILDGKLMRSCVVKMSAVPDEAQITTVEGIGQPGNLHPIQAALVAHGAPQCGYCMSGMVVSAKAFLDENKNPTRQQVRDWLTKYHNACRCNGYKPIVDSVMDAAKILRGELTVKKLEFKLPKDGRIWGSKYPRPSAIAKVTGTFDYGADAGAKLPPGTLQLALVQAKVSHANIKGIDTSEAEKMPGVFRVLT
ncbi:MAG TPA: 2Fe-2S iron-sulfur cluster-binding protein, partial [Anaerolineae bacterium]|nr:2Fe-2S iron-sulfur cluster-binding protein [Anaerolineae bacterium]